jgi:hypothetical protein
MFNDKFSRCKKMPAGSINHLSVQKRHFTGWMTQKRLGAGIEVTQLAACGKALPEPVF